VAEYRFKPGETVPDAIKRIAGEEVDLAIRQLDGQAAAKRDEAIHEARKSVKKIRGVLRLVQPEMGEIFALENALFRDIGRHLSQFRDAGAVVETFDTLRKKYRADLNSHSLAAVRRGLMARKAQAEKQSNIAEVLKNMSAALGRAASRVKTWPLSKDGFAALAPGFEDTLRRGQKAMSRARKRPRPENYHDWRKRVKEHWYHVRLLENLWDHRLTQYEKHLKDLEEDLGEDHNLVVLHDKVLAEPKFYGKPPEIRAFADIVGKYHDKLREDASSLGDEIYSEKPARFTRRLKRLWDVWQSK